MSRLFSGLFFTLIHDDPEVNKEQGRNNFPVPIDLQIINCTRIEGKIRVRRTLGYVVEDFDR